MALPWVDFLWSIRQYVKVRRGTPSSGSYTIKPGDYQLTANNTAAATWTLPAVSGSGQVLKVKNKGNGEITLSGTIFLDQVVSTLTLVRGDMVTLTDDGTHWSVGD
jgi:hypothetical protein